MRKISFVGLLVALAPSLCMGGSLRVNRLVQEKQRKMAELEKCMGSTKGLKIAGISTLGLTAVGVAGNVVEAKKIKDYDTKIASTDKSIEKTQQEIDDTKTTLATKKAEAEKAKQQQNAGASNGTPGNNNIPAQAVAPNQLPDYDYLCTAEVGGYGCDLDSGEPYKVSVDFDDGTPTMTVSFDDRTVAEQVCKHLEEMYGENGTCWEKTSSSTPDVSQQEKESICSKGGARYNAETDECDCPNGKEWVFSMMACQDHETAEKNKTFDDKVLDCLNKGAAGYDKNKGCICENEQTHIWDGSACIPIEEWGNETPVVAANTTLTRTDINPVSATAPADQVRNSLNNVQYILPN